MYCLGYIIHVFPFFFVHHGMSSREHRIIPLVVEREKIEFARSISLQVFLSLGGERKEKIWSIVLCRVAMCSFNPLFITIASMPCHRHIKTLWNCIFGWHSARRVFNLYSEFTSLPFRVSWPEFDVFSSFSRKITAFVEHTTEKSLRTLTQFRV